jgi:hypothetical protein
MNLPFDTKKHKKFTEEDKQPLSGAAEFESSSSFAGFSEIPKTQKTHKKISIIFPSLLFILKDRETSGH